MNKRKKIIQILCHSLINNENLMYHVYGGFGAKQIRGLRPYLQDYRYEIWYAVTGIHKVKRFVKDGLVYKLFPAKTVSKMLESYFGLIWCPSLFRELAKEKPNEVIIHFQGEHGSLLHQLLRFYPRYPVVLQYHGYGQSAKLDWIEKLFVTPIERYNFNRIHHFFVPIKPRISYLKQTIGISQDRISYENIGINYQKFKPMIESETRKSLNIPGNAFVVLYIGPFLESKGVKLIIDSYRQLKNKYRNLFLLFVGGNKTDPLYPLASQYADKIIGMIDNEQIPRIYAASNVLCFYGNEKMRKYAGPGIAPTEALACNLPVISTNLNHFPDTIYTKLGFIPKSRSEFYEALEFLIKNRNFKRNTRKLIEQFVSFEHISSKIGTVYEDIFAKSPQKN